MTEFIEKLDEWSNKNKKIAMARVIKTWGSSPRPVGSLMFINDEGHMLGSVSGGCVEGAVVKRALDVIENQSSVRLSYGVSDEDAWSVGLSCGGSIQVFVQYVDFTSSPDKQLLDAVKSNKSAIMISSLEDGNNINRIVSPTGEAFGDEISRLILDASKQAYDDRTNLTITEEDKDYFIHIFPHKPQLLVIGAAHITVDLVMLGNTFGFETVVIDPRGYFTKNTEFQSPPHALHEAYPSEVLDQYPLDAYTFCAILSHDPKIDDNALEVLLPSKVAYIGALGSRKTHAKRTNRLLEKGTSQEAIDRIMAPIGVSINAKSAREIALAVMAQIIEIKNKNL